MNVDSEPGVSKTPDSQLSQTSTTPIAQPNNASPQQRFVFVDGLRGLAALAIVLFHIWWYEPDPTPTLPEFVPTDWIDAAFLRIRAGVQVLLVISGFVIAHTLRNTLVTPREVIWFLGRRLVRLIPPYWVAIGVVILVDAICLWMGNLTSPFEGHLTIPRVSAHMTFMQDILGEEALSAGMWTICIEMQFYVVAIIALGFAQNIVRRPDAGKPQPSAWGLLCVYLPCAFSSLFFWRADDTTTMWVIHFFWMFFLGMMTCWALDRTVPRLAFGVVVAVAVFEIFFDTKTLSRESSPVAALVAAFGKNDWWYENTVALTTAVMIFIAGRLDRMHTWLNFFWVQYLGKISYSLYLIHFPVCHLVTLAAWRLFGDEPTVVQASVILVASFIASLLAAHTLYYFVEVPSNRSAAAMKRLQERRALGESSSSQST